MKKLPNSGHSRAAVAAASSSKERACASSRFFASSLWLLTLLLGLGTPVSLFAGAVTRVFYGGDPNIYPYEITGTTVADLTNDVHFPNSPTDQEVLGDLVEGTSNWGENYGSQLEGWLEAPQDGAYRFWLAGSDDSQLWLGTNANPASRRLIASLRGKTAPRDWSVYPSQQSAPIVLARGDVVYLQVLQKAGLGSDNLAIGWQLPDGTFERPMNAYHLQPYTNGVTTPEIIQQPADTNVVENTPVVFAVTATPSSQPYSYQWYQGTTAIPDATLSAYTKNAKLSDNGKKFSCRVNGTLASSSAVLTVTPDTAPPTVLFAGTRGNPYRVTVQFSEPVDTNTATDLSSYQINNGAVITAAVQTAPDVVELITALTQGVIYTLTVNGVKDLATAPNTIAFGTAVSFVVTDGVVQIKFWDSSGGTNAAASLTNLALLQTTASRTLWNTAFETPTWANGSNYLGQIAGFVTPIQSGDYVFGVAAGGPALLSLSTDESSQNKTQIAAVVSGSTGQREFNQFPEQLSSAISLVAGKRYYLDVIWEAAAAGGNGVSVTWQPPGTPAITDGQPAIPGLNLSALKTSGPVVITNQPPATIQGLENHPITLTIGSDGVDGSPIYTYQWTENGTNIAGATSYALTTEPLAITNDGPSFALVVSNAFSSTTSTVTRVTVAPDLVPPVLLSAGSIKPPGISVAFSEPLDSSSVTNLTNYVLLTAAGQPTPVTGAVLNARGDVVTLTAPSLVAGTQYNLTVSGVKDRAVAGNTLTNASVSFVPMNLTVVNINNSQPYSAEIAGSTLTFTAGGADIGDVADQFVYAYLQVTGDFDYRLDVHSLTASDPAAKSGLMTRVSTLPGSRFVFNSVMPLQGDNAYLTRVRSQTDAGATDESQSPPALYPDSWLRLQRVGSRVNSFSSADGSNWTQYASYDTAGDLAGAFPSNLLLGIATTSRNIRDTTTAVVSDFGPWTNSVVAQLRIDSIFKQGTNAVVRWTGVGVLQSAETVLGPWTDVPGATSPYSVELVAPSGFFRLRE